VYVKRALRASTDKVGEFPSSPKRKPTVRSGGGQCGAGDGSDELWQCALFNCPFCNETKPSHRTVFIIELGGIEIVWLEGAG
jgi:hypothetical protein